MKIGLFAFLISLLILDTKFIFNAQAADFELRLTCPATWPQFTRTRLRRVDFTTHFGGAAPLDFYADPSPYGAIANDELFCAYSNERSLLITIPGKPDKCFVVATNPPDSDNIINAYCTYQKTGDPVKDAVRVRETEPLNRSTSFHGLRLGMTREQTAAMRTAIHSESRDTFTLPNYGQIIVTYDDSEGKPGPIGEMELRPEIGLVHEMTERFGFPDVNGEPDDPMAWRGQDGVRLIVYPYRIFGSLALSTEDGFVLDGRMYMDLLDKQLKLDGP